MIFSPSLSSRVRPTHSLGLPLAIATFAFLTQVSQAQMIAPKINWETEEGEYLHQHNISPSFSYGIPYQRNAYFWGASLNYTYLIDFPWSVTCALAYDEETDSPTGKPKEVVSTLTAIATVDYSIAEWVTISSGIGKGFMDDSNGGFTFTDGDWGTGIAIGLTVPESRFAVLESLSFSTSWEWNLSSKEPSVSFDLGYGWSF